MQVSLREDSKEKMASGSAGVCCLAFRLSLGEGSRDGEHLSEHPIQQYDEIYHSHPYIQSRLFRGFETLHWDFEATKDRDGHRY